MATRKPPFGTEERGYLILPPHAPALLRHGFETVGNALRPTLGPTGRTVLIEQMIRTDSPEILDDAASVARRIVELPLQHNTGAMLMRHLVWRVFDQVGDGTATASVIAQALLREATKAIAAGAHPSNLRSGIESGMRQVMGALDQQMLPLTGRDMLYRAALAAGHDEELARTLRDIHEQHGTEIVVSVQEWLANGLNVEVADGAKWDAGYASAAFVNDHERSLAWSEEPCLLFTNIFLDRAEQLLPVMQRVVEAGHREFVVVASSITEGALAVMVANNERGQLHSVGILAPGLGDHRVGVLQDLAAQTGARFISDHAGDAVEHTSLDDLGQCDVVWASRDFFSIVDGAGTPEAIHERARAVRGAVERETDPFEREQLRKRLGRLTGGVALLSVGAATKTEMVERKSRAERAVKAVEAARRDGVVPGGGVALVHCADAVDTTDRQLSLDHRLGRLALARALEEPFRAIVENAGGEASAMLRRIREAGGSTGYDAVEQKLVDVCKAGIVDPVNVVRVGVQTGVSVGVMALTTDAIVIPRHRLLHPDPKP